MPVQVPRIERNAIAAVKVINAARMATRGAHLVSLDDVIATMRDTGRDMETKDKGASTGGLAVNVIECRTANDERRIGPSKGHITHKVWKWYTRMADRPGVPRMVNTGSPDVGEISWS